MAGYSISQNNLCLTRLSSSLKTATKINPDQFSAWRELARHHVVVGNNLMLPKERQEQRLGC
ncbi:MAG: hypothetical protein ACJZ15_07570 [Candidatus Neomarinimicrobiota bacterium]